MTSFPLVIELLLVPFPLVLEPLTSTT